MNKKYIILLGLALLAASCNPFSQTLAAGVVKSVNGGVNWQFFDALKSGATPNLSVLSISKLGFDPTNNERVYAGSYTGGFFKSDDSGATWTNILSKIYVYDFAVTQSQPQIIYTAGFFADHGRVLKTTDGGSSWNQVYNEESASNPVRAISINPDNPNQLVIGTSSGEVVKSSDGGTTWQLSKNFNDQINRILWQNGKIYVLLKTKGLFESADAGANFTELTSGLSTTYSLAGAAYTNSSISSFSQDFVDPADPNLIYITTDQGLYKSINAGKSWSSISLPVKPSQGATKAIAVGNNSSNIVFTSVGSTIYKSVDAGVTWQTQSITSGGFINYILINPQLPQIVYAGIYANPQ
ncbi:MAG TPA: hypothetical protein VE973_02485 [Candidatus Limnocylindria bacterium]|nr:hypothetical protein [Candidatus Limnocylindria bacterium]